MASGVGDFDIVMVARDVWGDTWRRRHYLADEFSRTRRVLFVEPPYPLLRGLAGRLEPNRLPPGRAIAAAGPREVQKNLCVVSPLKLFPETIPGGSALNARHYANTIKSAIESLGFTSYVLWLNPEYAVRLIPQLSPLASVYDVTDDWTGARLPAKQIQTITEDDRAMLNAADAVFTVSRNLYEKKSPYNKRAFLLTNGVKADLYAAPAPAAPADLAALPRPILGYAGTLHPQRIDAELLAGAARTAKGPFSIVLVGQNLLSAEQSRVLRAAAGIHLLGERNRLEVPAYISNFDVCLIPHVVDAFTESLNPIKIYEYLAAGKPVVTTVGTGMEEFAEFLAVEREPAGFAAAALRLAGSEGDSAARRAAVAAHTWAARAEKALEIIEMALTEKRRS